MKSPLAASLVFLAIADFGLRSAECTPINPQSAVRNPQSAIISGRVVDPDGRPVAGARVVLADAIGTTADRVTDGAGAFSIEGLAAGDYDIRVVADGFQADRVPLALGDRETRTVEIALRISAVAESIVVSASQVEVPLSRAADSVTVITAADLRAHQVETVSDALRLVPGLTVTRSGGRGAITSLFPRGGASNYALVLVDGIRANSFGGGYDFAHLSVAGVDRVEVVRGPQSALFGADAIGAVVHVVTKRGGAPSIDGLVEGGSQSTARAAANASGSSGDWRFGGAAEKTRSDGFTGIAPATGERVTNDDYHFSHASGTAEWQRPAGQDLLIVGQLGRDERGFPGPYGSNPIGAFSGVDRVSRGVNDTRQVGARFGHPWSSTARQRIDVNYTNLSLASTSAFGPSSSGTKRFDARLQEDVAIGSSIGASAGLELVREQGSSSFIIGATDEPLPIRRSVGGAFGELRYVSRERLFVTGGVRIEHISRDSVEGNVGPFSTRPPFPAQTVDSLNPKIAVSYVLSQGDRGDRSASTRLRASAGTGIRPPDAFEIAFTDNPDLQPERSRSVDAGVEQLFAGGRYLVSGTFFLNTYDDLIVTVGSSLRGASRYMTDNISNARARGLELVGSGRIMPGLTLRGTYTFLDTAILSVDGLAALAPPPFKTGDPLIRRPRHQGSIDVTYGHDRFAAFADMTLRSSILDVEPNFGTFGGLFTSAGYTVVNAGASVRIARGLEAYARVLNVADRAYEETLGFPALPRSAIVGVRVAAGR